MVAIYGLLCAVPIVEWDGSTKAGSKWDGSHHTSTVEQLTSLSHRTLGENGVSFIQCHVVGKISFSFLLLLIQ